MRAGASRAVLGPRNGITKYGPGGTPHTPSVWPKSSSCFSRPMGVATSQSPKMPSTVFTTKRAASVAPSFGLPCRKLLRHGADVLEVRVEVVDALLRERRHDLLVALRDRLHHRLVERIVESEGLAVEAFPGIAGLSARGGAAGKGEGDEQGEEKAHEVPWMWKKRIERSRASTSLVSEPMEMRCTPVSAMARTLSQIHAARGLELGAVAGDLHGLAHLREVEIVEEDQLRAGVERLAKLVERFHLHLQHHAGLRAVQRLAHRLRRGRRPRGCGSP